MGAAWLAQALPPRGAERAARAGGRILAATLRRRRAMAERHVRRARGGGLDDGGVRRAVLGTFDSYARYWMELFRLPALSPDEIVAGMRCEGCEHIDAARAAGTGLILALPHVGNWDFAGAWVVQRGTPVTAAAELVEPPELFDWFVEVRRGLGMEIIPLGPHAGTALVRALRENRAVALLCDRDIQGGGVEVEFFGERTTLPGGPATLSLRTGAPILPTAAYFEPDGGHVAVVGRPLPAERTGRLRDDVTRVTQALATELEALILRAPDQWHLFQPNWPSDHERRC